MAEPVDGDFSAMPLSGSGAVCVLLTCGFPAPFGLAGRAGLCDGLRLVCCRATVGAVAAHRRRRVLAYGTSRRRSRGTSAMSDRSSVAGPLLAVYRDRTALVADGAELGRPLVVPHSQRFKVRPSSAIGEDVSGSRAGAEEHVGPEQQLGSSVWFWIWYRRGAAPGGAPPFTTPGQVLLRQRNPLGWATEPVGLALGWRADTGWPCAHPSGRRRPRYARPAPAPAGGSGWPWSRARPDARCARRPRSSRRRRPC